MCWGWGGNIDALRSPSEAGTNYDNVLLALLGAEEVDDWVSDQLRHGEVNIDDCEHHFKDGDRQFNRHRSSNGHVVVLDRVLELWFLQRSFVEIYCTQIILRAVLYCVIANSTPEH